MRIVAYDGEGLHATNKRGNTREVEVRTEDHTVIRLAAFLSPFALIQAINLSMLTYFAPRTDAVEAMAQLGDNFLRGRPYFGYYVPMTTWAELSAVLLAVVGHDWWMFHVVGFAVQWGLLCLIGVWVYRMEVSALEILTLSTMAATMPSALAYSTSFNQYYLLPALSIPLAIGLYRRDPRIWGLLGFLTANAMMVLPIAAAALFLVKNWKPSAKWATGGFLIGANVLAPWWPLSFVNAVLGKGGAGSHLPFQQWVLQIDPVWLLTLCVWNALILAILVRPSWFAVTATLLTLAGSAELAMRPHAIPVGSWGIEVERYFVLMPAVIGYALLGVRRKRLVLAIVALVGVLSMLEYLHDQRAYLTGNPKLWFMVDDTQQYRR